MMTATAGMRLDAPDDRAPRGSLIHIEPTTAHADANKTNGAGQDTPPGGLVGKVAAAREQSNDEPGDVGSTYGDMCSCLLSGQTQHIPEMALARAVRCAP